MPLNKRNQTYAFKMSHKASFVLKMITKASSALKMRDKTFYSFKGITKESYTCKISNKASLTFKISKETSHDFEIRDLNKTYIYTRHIIQHLTEWFLKFKIATQAQVVLRVMSLSSNTNSISVAIIVQSDEHHTFLIETCLKKKMVTLIVIHKHFRVRSINLQFLPLGIPEGLDLLNVDHRQLMNRKILFLMKSK